MASWASWAPALALNCRGASGRYAWPYRAPAKARAAATASSDSRKESVRMYVMRPTVPSPSMSTPS